MSRTEYAVVKPLVLLSLLMLAPAAAQEASSSKKYVTYRYGQRAPTKARYKEIQRALKERGYNPGPIDGQWGSKTSAALKRFERDHNLRADGKLDSLALIALGLGPKRLNSVSPNSVKTSR
jgi:peptidoglycan hydrolase-like protein with peptidoglycan-binding domain